LVVGRTGEDGGGWFYLLVSRCCFTSIHRRRSSGLRRIGDEVGRDISIGRSFFGQDNCVCSYEVCRARHSEGDLGFFESLYAKACDFSTPLARPSLPPDAACAWRELSCCASEVLLYFQETALRAGGGTTSFISKIISRT